MNRRNWKVVALFAGLVAVPVTLLAVVPYSFVAGQPIRASEINANFAAVESEIAAGLSSVRPDYARASVEYRSAGVGGSSGANVSVITVPSAATRPYLLRQVMTTSATSCLLYFGAETIPIAPYTTTGLSIQFAAGSVLTASCLSAGGNVDAFLTFVFEK